MRRIGAESEGGGSPLTRQESIITFQEPGVSVSGVGIGLESGSLTLSPDGAVDLGSENGFTTVGESGLIIRPQVDISGLQVEVAQNTDTFGGVVVNEWTDQDGAGNTLVQADGAGAGDTIDLSGATLSGGQKYAIIAFRQQDFRTGKGTLDSNDESADGSVEVVDGYIDGTTDGSEWYTFSLVEFTLAQDDFAEAIVASDDPPDVGAWDIASYRSTPEEGSVEVYIESSEDGGASWTTVQGPIGRGEEINASSDSQIRYRVELSRPAGTPPPKADSLYRRWEV